jgi:hypothetical protein
VVEQATRTIRRGIELYLALSPYLPENFDLAAFDRRSARVADFLKNRMGYVIGYITERYALGSPYALSVDVPRDAGVTVNTYTSEGDFKGTYFTHYPTTLTPVVPIGYAFDYWMVNGVRRTDRVLTVEDVFAYTGKVQIKLVLRREEGLRVTAVGYDGENDYVVLTNLGETDLTTEGYYLSDNEIAPYRYAIPLVSVPSGESVVIYGEDFAKETESELYMNFNLGKNETLCLSYVTADGASAFAIDRVWLPPKMQDTSSYERNLTDGKFYEVLAGEK